MSNMANTKLNGSVNILADAMQKVFNEAMEGAVGPLTTEIKGLRSGMDDMEGRLNTRIDSVNETTNQNMQAQFAEQQKQIGGVGSKVDKLVEAQLARYDNSPFPGSQNRPVQRKDHGQAWRVSAWQRKVQG